MKNNSFDSLSCPMPIMNHDTIQLAHGAGGTLSFDLIERFFLPRFGNDTLNRLEDQAILEFPGQRLAFTTDSFVVDPLFFPGGDIGSLAINGTVNDICMCGATPLYISTAFILEEGLSLETLHRITVSMQESAKVANVTVVTGDTKVVDKGSCDKLFINTTGIGVVPDGINISARNLRVGDKIILSGTIGDHGMAVLTIREGLSFQSQVKSDCAALNDLVANMLEQTGDIHAMRDPTRGGLATTLNEFARSSQVGIQLYGDQIPVKPGVQGACEVLGIDPLYVANEGKLVAAVPQEREENLVKVMREHHYGKDTVIIGEVVEEHPGMIVMSTGFGVNRIIDMPVGEQLPRIC